MLQLGPVADDQVCRGCGRKSTYLLTLSDSAGSTVLCGDCLLGVARAVARSPQRDGSICWFCSGRISSGELIEYFANPPGQFVTEGRYHATCATKLRG